MKSIFLLVTGLVTTFGFYFIGLRDSQAQKWGKVYGVEDQEWLVSLDYSETPYNKWKANRVFKKLHALNGTDFSDHDRWLDSIFKVVEPDLGTTFNFLFILRLDDQEVEYSSIRISLNED
jgi:hypothetical protein